MTLDVAIAGAGAWTPAWPGWTALCDAVGPSGTPSTAAAGRPVPLSLPPAERRRVPDGVAVALEVAREALAAASADPSTIFETSTLCSVFASAHGELAIVDYLCRTLADDPLLLSPTRFHHSVHNAAAGYWSIATPSVGASISIAAGDASFAVGLLEAATQVVVDRHPVLVVVFDTPGVGPLARAAQNTALFGAALLLVPHESDDRPRLSIALHAATIDDAAPSTGDDDAFRAVRESSPAAHATPLLVALARSTDATLTFATGGGTMSVRVRHRHAAAPTAESSTVA